MKDMSRNVNIIAEDAEGVDDEAHMNMRCTEDLVECAEALNLRLARCKV